jgi:hypothetical protein
MHFHLSPYLIALRLTLVLLAVSLATLSCNGSLSRTSGPVVSESGQSPWIQDRIAALQAVYSFTPQGQLFLEEHDLRQMKGQPGWFGSFGYGEWTGVGEARPGPIAHELGHAYWGAFEVSGRPDLSWTQPGPGNSSSAMSQFHQDLTTFMAQPPDPYEPLRERLRNLPRVMLGETSVLIHFGEADLVHATGGNALLLPPLLRKYFDQFLPQGNFDSWYSALEWYQGLSSEDARVTGAYFGLNHLDLGLYRDLDPQEKTALPQGIREILEQEEEQRLVDFARQFDIVTGVEKINGDLISLDLFFLRGYLRDKLALHKRYPDTLADLGEEPAIATALAQVMDTFASLDGKTLEERADILGQRLTDPFFSNFWPLVDNDLLMELHSRGIAPQDMEPMKRTSDAEIERLNRIAAQAGSILGLAQENIPAEAAGLAEAVREALENDTGEIGLVIELLSAADRETTKAMGRNLDHNLVRKLLEEASGTVRQLLGPEDLLPMLGIAAEVTVEEMVRGIQELIQGTSGNFRIDQPYFSRVYELVAQRGMSHPQEALSILLQSGLFPEELIREHPREAVAILASDLDRAASLIAGVGGYGRTPQGLVHSIIYVDPSLAAELVSRLDSQDPSAVQKALVYFAYDSYRKARLPSLKVSPKQDGLFLLALADLRGDQWVIERMGEAIATYDGYAKATTVPPDFLEEYRNTLSEVANLMDIPEATVRLHGLVDEAFSLAGLE